MIKKKKYKRKNPKIEEIPLTPKEIIYLKYELIKALVGDWVHLANAQKLLKIGFICTDCNKKYEYCACEWCNDCNSKECFCNFRYLA